MQPEKQTFHFQLSYRVPERRGFPDGVNARDGVVDGCPLVDKRPRLGCQMVPEIRPPKRFFNKCKACNLSLRFPP